MCYWHYFKLFNFFIPSARNSRILIRIFPCWSGSGRSFLMWIRIRKTLITEKLWAWLKILWIPEKVYKISKQFCVCVKLICWKNLDRPKNYGASSYFPVQVIFRTPAGSEWRGVQKLFLLSLHPPHWSKIFLLVQIIGDTWPNYLPSRQICNSQQKHFFH